MTDELLDLGLPVQVRDIPAMRVARLQWSGAPAAIGEAFERVTAFAVRHGVGPVGPLVGMYPQIADGAERIEAEIQVPLTRLVESDDEAIETLRVPRCRAACLMYNGPMDARFRLEHGALFDWMDARGLPRTGTAHHHAYITGTSSSAEWTVEIRVPVVGGQAPSAPL